MPLLLAPVSHRPSGAAGSFCGLVPGFRFALPWAIFDWPLRGQLRRTCREFVSIGNLPQQMELHPMTPSLTRNLVARGEGQ
jgi:hypothetical protein